MAPTFAYGQLQRSLRRFITFDQVTCLVAVTMILAVHAWLFASGYLVLLAVAVGLAGGVMGLGRRQLTAGDLAHAVLWVAAANWGISMAATAVATFCLPVTVVAAMLPSVLAVPYVSGALYWRINAISCCVATLTVLLGTVQDFSGLTGRLPDWIPPTVLIAFAPFVAGLVIMVSAHNGARLTRAIVETSEANDRLRASEVQLRRSRARTAAATDEERRRISRDLHDGAQQRLLSIALGIRRTRRLLHTDPTGADGLLERLAGELQESLAELRDLAHGVYPAVLIDRGLAEALIELAARARGCWRVEVGSLPRRPAEVEAAVYWCCVEALQNVAKHAGPETPARVRVAAGEAGTLVFQVEDEGPGFDPARVRWGQGLTNMADRVGAVGGTLRVLSVPGAGVRVHGVVPFVPTSGSSDEGADRAAAQPSAASAGERARNPELSYR